MLYLKIKKYYRVLYVYKMTHNIPKKKRKEAGTRARGRRSDDGRQTTAKAKVRD